MKQFIFFSIVYFFSVGDFIAQDKNGEMKIIAQTKSDDCDVKKSGSAWVDIEGGTPPFIYSWSTGATTDSIYGLNEGTYVITVIDSVGNKSAQSIVVDRVCVISPSVAFTPNGDGFNDEWSIININAYRNHQLIVYNRWGMKVFESNESYIPWDGMIKGGKAPSATYYYIILMDKDEKGKDENVIKGTVNIIR